MAKLVFELDMTDRNMQARYILFEDDCEILRFEKFASTISFYEMDCKLFLWKKGFEYNYCKAIS